MSICTKGEPQGEGGQGMKTMLVARTPTLSQPSHPCLSLSALLPATTLEPACCWGAAPSALCMFRGPRWACRVPPMPCSLGTEPAQLTEKVGLRRVVGCSGRGATPGAGCPTLPTLSFRAVLGGLPHRGEGTREGERAPGPPSASDTGETRMFPSVLHRQCSGGPWGGHTDHPYQEGDGYLLPHYMYLITI